MLKWLKCQSKLRVLLLKLLEATPGPGAQVRLLLKVVCTFLRIEEVEPQGVFRVSRLLSPVSRRAEGVSHRTASVSGFPGAVTGLPEGVSQQQSLAVPDGPDRSSFRTVDSSGAGQNLSQGQTQYLLDQRVSHRPPGCHPVPQVQELGSQFFPRWSVILTGPSELIGGGDWRLRLLPLKREPG